MQSSQQDHHQQQLLAQKDQMEYQMQLQHNHNHHQSSHNDDMEADQSLLQKLPSLSNNSNGLIKMDGIYMSDLTMKRGIAPSASGSSLASSDATSRGSVSYDGDEMESQGDHDFDDSFSSQTTSGSMGVSGMVASRGGSLDGSGMMNHDGSSTSPSPSLLHHHQELQDAPSFFKQYSMKSNSPQFNSDAGAMNQASPSTFSTSPTSNSPSFPTATSPNFSFDKRTGMAGSEGMVEGASPRGSVSSMVSLSPRDVSPNLRSNSYTSSPSQHSQLQSLGGNFNSNLYTSPIGAASGTQVNQHRPSLGESLGLTLGQQAAESSSSSRGQPGMMQQAVAEYNSISGSSPLNNGVNSIFSPNSYSGSKNRPTPPAKLSLPPLNFFQNAKSGSQFNAPFTPGGSLFYGARDGAASGEPLSPFEPPTPLKRVSGDGRQDSNPMDSPLNRYAKLPSIGSMGTAGQMMGEGGASPSAHAHALSRLQRKRPSLPPALGGMGAVRRASYSPNSSSNSYSVGSIPPYHAMHQQQHEQELQSPTVPISPLRQEFANVHVDSTAGTAMEEDLPGKDSDEHMRTLTRSSIDVVMGLRQLNEEASSSVAAASSSASSYGAQSATSSPSTLSAASMSTTATSNFTPPCSPLTISSALPSTSSTKQKQRSPSPMQTSVDMRRTSSGNKPRAKEALIGSSSNVVAQSHSMTTRAKKSVVAPISVKARSVSPPSLDLPSKGASEKAGEATPMPSSAPPTQTTFGASIDASPSVSSMTLSPPTETSALPVLRSVPMVKSKTAPAIPNTVSAKHLSTRTLHPHFVSTYDLGDELGSGGFGFVVSAKRRTDGMPVAVKFIWKNKVPSHGWVKDPRLGIVPMEVFVLKVVDCPFVVKFVEAFDDTEFFYLVMEHHGTPWVANTKENKAAAAAAAAASQGKGISEPPTAPMMQSSKSLPGSSSTPAKPFGGLTPLESPKVAVFAPNSNTPSLTSDSEMSDAGNDSRSSISSSSISSTGAEAASTAPSRPGMPQRRLSCDLFECIEQHSRLTESRARWVFAQVVEAVYHLDRMGISHRDIKDENCVIDADFNVKLIDFGSAVISDVRKPAPYFNRFFGTMTFASAEILQGKMYRAPNAEIWSLGVLLSILLSGECPFEDPKAAMAGRIGVGKGWSREAKELISGCLDVDPDRRANIGEVREHPWVKRAWKEQGKDRPL